MPDLRRLSILVVFALSACSAASGPTSSPSPPTASSTPAPDVALQVFPAEEPTAIRMAIPGSKYAFLVTVEGAAAEAAATITASATGARIVEIRPSQLRPGAVSEVWVVADATTAETTGSVTITATRGGSSKSVTRSLPVFPMTDERAADARPYFERWTAWLATSHPELGISASTEWQPVFVSTLLVVSHYSYWSKDWEMTVAWHNMIPPSDWTDVFLRRRGSETAPSLAFRIDSVKGNSAPHPIDPPKDLVR